MLTCSAWPASWSPGLNADSFRRPPPFANPCLSAWRGIRHRYLGTSEWQSVPVVV